MFLVHLPKYDILITRNKGKDTVTILFTIRGNTANYPSNLKKKDSNVTLKR